MKNFKIGGSLPAAALTFAFALFVLCPPPATGQNARPNVIPSLREWTGSTGTFTMSTASRICVDTSNGSALPDLMAVAGTFQSDMKYVNGFSPAIVTASCPATADFYLAETTSDPVIGTEGYLLTIGSFVTINAATRAGVFYGTRTALQLLKQSIQLPRGNARDYPNYHLRGFMLDASTQKFDIGTVKDYVKYMAWYKMNDFHIHLNDNAINPKKWQTAYATFRIQDSAYPGLAENSSDGIYWTPSDFQALQELAAQYSVQIVPEIDTPAHALELIKYAASHGITNIQDPTYTDELDLSNLANNVVYNFMDGVWNTYIATFNSPSIHIGGDEYYGANDPYKTYVDHYNALVKANGKSARMWGEWAASGGAANVDKDITLNLWNPSYYNPQQAISDGFLQIINSMGSILYIVPLSGSWPDYMDSQWMYNNWQPFVFSQDHSMDLQPNDPHLLGAAFSLWGDFLGQGYDLFDCYDRVKPAMFTIAEKSWSGASGGATYNNFYYLGYLTGNAPGTNLQRPIVAGNLAGEKFATASSSSSLSNQPQNAVDGSSTSNWFSQTSNPQWINVDLGQVYSVGKVVLSWASAYGKSYQVQVSTDNALWTTVFSTTSGAGGTVTITFPSIGARYVRMYGTQSQRSKGFSLYELQVFQQ